MKKLINWIKALFGCETCKPKTFEDLLMEKVRENNVSIRDSLTKAYEEMKKNQK